MSTRNMPIASIAETSFANTDRPPRAVGSGAALLCFSGSVIGFSPADEAVPDTSHRTNERRLPRVVAELLPQAADQHIHRAIERLPVDAMRPLDDALAAEDTIAVAHEKSEELELRRRERERPAVQPHGARVEVEL